MIAIISDIHANSDALARVMARIQEMGVTDVLCLGDIVGYGGDPEACIDQIEKTCQISLCGNHDYALIYGAHDFNQSALDAINYHRHRLIPRLDGSDKDAARVRRWQYLKGLAFRHVEDNCLFVHGSPRDPIHEYIMESDVRWGLERKLREILELIDWLCFVGHTHRPCVITQQLEFLTADQLEQTYKPEPGQKAIINVGSVGQPRDGDTRASFVTVDDDRTVHWHRVEYDVEGACKKIEKSGILDESCAERLRVGR
jgi:diadenosine tetraphosphatase ApaH/serine/threonine PP2A family protein phosphatase